MNPLNDIIAELSSLPEGVKLTDPTRLQGIIRVAEKCDGANAGTIESLRFALEQHTNAKPAKIAALCRSMTMRAELGAIPDGYEGFVDAWTTKQNVTYTLDRTLRMAGKNCGDSYVFDQLFLAAVKLVTFDRKDVLTAAWRIWKQNSVLRELEKFQSNIAFVPNAPDEWLRVVEALVLKNSDHSKNVELALAVLKGAVWRVKNKLRDRCVTNHIMPYLRGRQWCGKTQYLRWFLSPVQEGVCDATFELFTHDEKADWLRTSPIVCFDEVAKADRIDAAKVKNLMTAETTMFRKLYGEATKGRVLSTFFGAGNLELEEVFNDPTGLRRFFQIDVNPDLWERLNALKSEGVDPINLWRSVDENAPSPLDSEDIVEKLKVSQHEHRNLTPIEAWLTDISSRPASRDYQDTETLFMGFCGWKNGRFPLDKSNIHQFQTQLARVLEDQSNGVYPYEHKKDSRTRRSLYLLGKPEEAPISFEEFRHAA